MRYVELPLAPLRTVQLEVAAQPGVAFSALDAEGVQVIPALTDAVFLGADNHVKLDGAGGTTLALGAATVRDLQQRIPIWIESTGGAFRMFYAVWNQGTFETHEVPYPFAEGTGPRLVVSRQRRSVLLIDQSPSSPYDILVAIVTIRNVGDVTVQKEQLNAVAQGISLVLESTEEDVVTNQAFVQRVVLLFKTADMYQVLQTVEAVDPWSEPSSVTEFARGMISIPVVGGSTFIDGFCSDGLARVPEYTHPVPFAVVTTTGDVLVLQFDGTSYSGESFPLRYGHVSPGTSVLGLSQEGSQVFGVWAAEPTGSLTILKDSDCTTLSSATMQPQSFAVAAATHSASSIDDGGWNPSYTSGTTLVWRN